jgi:hypothetical protein
VTRWAIALCLVLGGLLIATADNARSLFGGHGVTATFSVSYGTAFKYNSVPPKSASGDSWAPTTSDDNNIYTTADDAFGFNGEGVGGSNILIARLSAPDTSMVGTTINQMTQFGGSNHQSSVDFGTYKVGGIISVNGVLYLSVSRQGTQPTGTPSQVASEVNATIIKSTDHGSNWTPLPATSGDPYATTMFTNQVFAGPGFMQYGQDYQGNTVDNSNLYVYATSNEGCWNNCSKLFLGRALITDMPALDGTKWSFFQGGDGMSSGNWGAWATAAPLITATNQIGNVSQAQFIPGLNGGTYVYIAWYYAWPAGFTDPSVSWWGLYTSPKPWGPYTLRDTKQWNTEPGVGLYSPNIITKSISVVGNVATMNVICAGDFNNFGDPNGDYTLTIVPLTLTAH